ncbi:MAG: hypothetical protein ACFFB5_20875 [Promethearchaeota archaeon]
MDTVLDLVFGLSEGVLFTVVSCMIAVKLTNIMTGQTDNDIVWGGILFGQSLLIELGFLLIYLNLATLKLTIYERTFLLFEYLTSTTYCGVVIIISLVFLPIACILLTKARID